MSINNVSVKDLLNSDLETHIKTKKKIPKHAKIKSSTIGDFMYEKSITTKSIILYIALSLACIAIIIILYNL